MSRPKTPPPLSAKDPNSFAYPTMKDRIPVILSKVVDHLNRNKDKICKQYGGEPAREELKAIIGAMSQLRHEVMTNKPAAPLRDSRKDASVWNAELEKEVEKNGGEPMKWFDHAWLWMECYMYRRVQEAALMCTLLKGYDLFGDQKQAAFNGSYKPVSTLTMYLMETVEKFKEQVPENELKQYFTEFVQMSLWGNKCDLSISGGSENHQEHCPIEQLTKLKPKLLVDDADMAFEILCKSLAAKGGREGQVDIVLDNAGFELLTDLCLAEFLIASGLASTIHFHAKAMPWFVSDVTEEDFNWTLKHMMSMNHLAISRFSQSWKKRIRDGTWVLHANDFWSMPNDYSEMQEVCPELHAQLSQADFIFFKGDLNYRKLVGDRQWDTTTSFPQTLRGFQPAPLCVMRTLKSDVVAGLRPGQAKDVEAKDANWMITGEWAVISVSEGNRSAS